MLRLQSKHFNLVGHFNHNIMLLLRADILSLLESIALVVGNSTVLAGLFNARSAVFSRLETSGLETEGLIPREDCRRLEVPESRALDFSVSVNSCSSGEEVSRGSVEKRLDDESGLFSFVSRTASTAC